MEITESVKIIERMMSESKKSLHNYSVYFLIWGTLMMSSGLVEYFLHEHEMSWIVWPAASIVGGIASFIAAFAQRHQEQPTTTMDRVIGYTWGSFGFCLILGIAYSLSIKMPPHTLVLILAGGATFISGGISKFKPFIYGGLALEIGAIVCAFFVPIAYHSLVFAIAILFGYIVPGVLLRKAENE